MACALGQVDLVECPEWTSTDGGKTRGMLVDVVAVVVLLLMAGDVFRMLFIDTEPQRDRVRRNDDS